ncbi:hypothetical protein ABIE37_000131 [Arthrobacter bambusae]|uniref:Glycoside hydrolase family 65 n=1 Tax=Arthrobacter bambusae TaxID=1338426 RepID=A0ABV2P1A9_9MICC
MPEARIDRQRLVRRHNPVLTRAHPADVLTVGNGDIALSVDVSGLQSFPAFHEIVPDPYRVVRDGTTGLPPQRERVFNRDDFQIPLRTQSTWGWYATRPTRTFDIDQAATVYETARGPVAYLDRMGLQRAGDPITDEFAAGAWFHYNPRRAHLGRLALVRTGDSGPLEPSVISGARTELDLWSGCIEASYTIAGERVRVTTVADPEAHRFVVRVESALLSVGWGVAWVFDSQPDDLASFEEPLVERTEWAKHSTRNWVARRTIESTTYGVTVLTTGELDEHGVDGTVATTPGTSLEVAVTLNPTGDLEASSGGGSFSEVCAAAASWWSDHWESGAAVSFEGSSDDAAFELERRVVLSQYLLAVNSAGTTPPAETGLTCNTWTGKFHIEMHWWHAAQFALWGRGHLLERSLGFYHGALARACETARGQGYKGARWPKQTDPSARESPSNIGVFLIWQQPHIIHLLELLWHEGRDENFLRKHYPLIEATAEFMADFAQENNGSFRLPPPLIPAQESYLVHRETITNPTFELAYWVWALRIANDWRARLGLAVNANWRRVEEGMDRPAQLADGTYAAIATDPYLIREDHPSMLMALGWLPDTELIDAETMAATLESVWEKWDLQSSWGWDYPVLAMSAARLGDLDRALSALLLPSPKNVFLPNGHNPQIPGFLTLYLPANGGLLAAVAHVVAAVEAGARLPGGWWIVAEGLGTLQRSRAIAAPIR